MFYTEILTIAFFAQFTIFWYFLVGKTGFTKSKYFVCHVSGK